ncbi:MAG: glutamate-5-semialdehyde dehydrogenase [Chloroflexota bacterium]|nr:glutamate-5-semialdehyde dehydrogenase [Chloroflexota bacterium]
MNALDGTPGGHMATTTDKDALLAQGRTAQAAAKLLARTSTEMKNQALLNVANGLETEQEPILSGNRVDYDTAKAGGMDEAMLDRLLLTPDRLLGMAGDVRAIAGLPDPVEEVIDGKTLANGLEVERRRVPLGVIGSIYESRPNITVDIAALTLKSGNACLLRGGRESLHSNLALVGLLRRAIGEAGINPDVVQYVDNPDRELVDTMLQMKEYINLLVPRGGAGLINFVAASAAMPVVAGGVGVCHTYVDRTADLEKAARIVFNAKVQRPTVCNALDTVLVHSEVAPGCLPDIARNLSNAGVELHCDHRALSILGPEPGLNTQPATEEDWGKEFLSLTAAIKIVDSLDEALEHIDTYGSGHTEAIITSDADASRRFQRDVDAAAVIVNASSRFTDGGQLGLGAEVGISTQKFHARGPLGLAELTSYKWVIIGDGQVRE